METYRATERVSIGTTVPVQKHRWRRRVYNNLSVDTSLNQWHNFTTSSAQLMLTDSDAAVSSIGMLLPLTAIFLWNY